ncbi:MAG TPA: SDR family NAD(P)-dependent oxidoreductase [Desulfobacteraceae bacterium]|nr:SDR family NAD(P)-dependent oxidoreductase [Desulfobacteraceae bacterium]
MEKIREIIADQTGYTTDMLEDDLDLEADLGIDTVKQVEIFAKTASFFGFDVPDDLKLRDLNTIAKLAEYVAAVTGPPDTPPEGSGSPKTPAATKEKETFAAGEKSAPAPLGKSAGASVSGDHGDEFPDPSAPVKRLVVRTQEAALPADKASTDFTGKTFVVTPDSHGFAKAVIEKIEEKKGRVVIAGPGRDADFQCDLSDIRSVEEQAAALKEKHGTINGFIHLASLDAYFSNTLAANLKGTDPAALTDDAELNRGFKSVFAVIKTLFQQLDTESSIIGTITFDSVVFPYMEGCGPIHPSFAALSGLLKTVNKEMDKTLVKVVDFSNTPFSDIPGNKDGVIQPEDLKPETIEAMAETFITELLSNDTRTEVGYRNNTRYVLAMKPEPLFYHTRQEPIIEPGSTMLVTGGAGGITYEIIKKVVEKYQTNLIILDINDIYGVDKKYLENSIGQPEIMAMLKQDQPQAKPLEIKKASDRIMLVRKAVKNIEHLEAMGVNVSYNVVDVTDPEAVKAAVDRHEKIDGVFHAAGMEMSQFIPKKELSAFELVVDVKVKGLVNLLTAMANREYQYLFTFSSVTARFGNEGQVDYTSANDFLSKALFREKQRHPGRNYKVYAWTAWSGTGMATNPTVMKVLEERGIQFLPMDQGVTFFMADLLNQDELEMVFSGLDYSFDRDGLLGDPANPDFPFLDEITDRDKNSATFSRTLDIERDLFLRDHAMEDVPVFLGSTGIETLAEAASSLAGNHRHLVELTDFSIPYGIKLLKERPKELTIRAEKQGEDHVLCTISSQFKNPKGIAMGDPTLHYQGKFRFADAPLDRETTDLPVFNPVAFDGDHREIVYNPKRLFMEGLFETITEVNSFDEKTLVTTLEDTSTKEFFRGTTRPRFQTPAVIVDAMFQTGGLFEFFTTSQTVLPYRIGSLKFYRAVEKNTPYYCITTKTGSSEETNTYQLKLCRQDGTVLIGVEDFEMVRLNMLEEQDRIDHRVTYGAASKA